MSDIKKVTSARQFRRHTTRSRRLSRHLREDGADRSPKRWSPVPLRPRAASDTDANSTAKHPPLRLAQLARQLSFAVHVDNWRDDMIAGHQYLPMQQILGSLESDAGMPLLSDPKARRSKGTAKSEQTRHHLSAREALKDTGAAEVTSKAFDSPAPNLQWQDWSFAYDQRYDADSLSMDQDLDAWHASTQRLDREHSVEPASIFQDLVYSIETDTVALSEEFDKFVNYQDPAEQCKAKL